MAPSDQNTTPLRRSARLRSVRQVPYILERVTEAKIEKAKPRKGPKKPKSESLFVSEADEGSSDELSEDEEVLNAEYGEHAFFSTNNIEFRASHAVRKLSVESIDSLDSRLEEGNDDYERDSFCVDSDEDCESDSSCEVEGSESRVSQSSGADADDEDSVADAVAPAASHPEGPESDSDAGPVVPRWRRRLPRTSRA